MFYVEAVGRPREFDEGQVIARAREAFWSRGVAATSVADISTATGLSVGSIYKAFTSKGELCQRTLDDYLAAGQERLRALFAEASSARDGLQEWIDLMAAQAGDDSPTCGCYAVVCATELAETDPVVRASLKRHDRIVEARKGVSTADARATMMLALRALS
jgi:TetR/AcrR family transcriptional repressor of nem operon